MAVLRTHKQSDLQRHLKILEYQLYGKKERLEVRSEKLDNEVGGEKPRISESHIPLQVPTSTSDITYLKQDLLKILIIASLAVAVQLVLYLSSAIQKIKLPI